jgi:6-carboxyhexanoate--CoA ligase
LNRFHEPIQQIKALQIIEDDKANLQNLTQECGVTEQALNQPLLFISSNEKCVALIPLCPNESKRLPDIADRIIAPVY